MGLFVRVCSHVGEVSESLKCSWNDSKDTATFFRMFKPHQVISNGNFVDGIGVT